MNKLVIAFAVIALAAVCHGAASGSRQTDCQRRAEQERRVTALPGHIVPECDANGEYKAKQCFGARRKGNPFCSCYTRDYVQIKGPSTKITDCECVRERHEILQQQRRAGNRAGNVPTCNEETGEYVRG
ncbi:U20-hexatoxin-Hi1a-like [Ornithodoros turicata]|uniref:U20-hexatoxin-Hi1a-like n=1 Tax=Ornithodoros turicata TaxID=34597 RepID=UPI0031396CEA